MKHPQVELVSAASLAVMFALSIVAGTPTSATPISTPEPAPTAKESRDAGSHTFARAGGWAIAEAKKLGSSQHGVQYVFEYPTTGLTVTIGVLEAGSTDIQSELQANIGDQLRAAMRDGVSQQELKEAQRAIQGGASRASRLVFPGDATLPPGLDPYDVSKQGSSAQVAPAATAGTCGSAYWPSSMKVYAEDSTSGTRYGRLYFTWSASNLANLKACNNVTFEPDFVTYNYEDAHYYAASGISSWSSTMPNAYQDTNAFDGKDELVYTVGYSDATALAAGTRYTTFFRAPIGNAPWDTMKVVAQRGHRTPPFCYSTWCIFADSSKRFPASGWVRIPATGTIFYP